MENYGNVDGALVLVTNSMAVQRAASEAAADARVALIRATTENIDHAAPASPLAMLIDLDMAAAKTTVLRLRANPRLATVPIIGIGRQVDEIIFQEIFWWGMDDLTGGSSHHGLTARVRALANRTTAVPPGDGGVAVIEGEDQGFRVRMGRVFANTLHSVRFAVSAAEAVSEAAKDNVSVVVSAAPEDPEAPLSVLLARHQGIEVPWLVGATPRDEARLRPRLDGIGRAGVFDTYAPPENALYRANELSRADGVESRRAARLLYGAVARFRAAGTDEDDFGLTYNVSTTGLYVRTLAPLPPGTDVWLELCPPRTTRPVRLHGRAVWLRPFGPSHTAVIPPGMGVHLVGSSPDHDIYQAGVDAYAQARGYGHGRGVAGSEASA